MYSKEGNRGARGSYFGTVFELLLIQVRMALLWRIDDSGGRGMSGGSVMVREGFASRG